MRWLLPLLLIVLMPLPALGQNAAMPAIVDSAPHPVLSPDGTWVGVMVLGILALFLAAALVGPIAQANMADELPPLHSHDEPPGASHHHGPAGITQDDDPMGHR